jgi:hypothetical protein
MKVGSACVRRAGNEYKISDTSLVQDVAPSSLMEVCGHVRGSCCFHHEGDESS